MNKRNTLDSAGFTYNPYTQMDTFGHPSGAFLPAIESKELFLGADNSALPQLGNPGLQFATAMGSTPDAAAQWQQSLAARAKQSMATNANVTLAAFIGILVLALCYRAQGSP